MADEDNESEGKKKKPLLKIIILAVVGLLVLALTVVGTLFVSGFFDKKDVQSAEEQLAKLEGAADGASNPASQSEPQKVTKNTPELTRFENHYLEIERDLVANLTNSRKVMQVKLAIMTHYDERVFNNVKKHEFALRAAALDVMRQVTEAELSKPEFRKELAQKIRSEFNNVLVKYEDFGGIEEVFFTNFVVQ